jgi:penicillin-binding protein 1B
MAGSLRRRLRSLLVAVVVALIPLGAAAAVAGWIVYENLATTLEERFRGRIWDFPSRILTDEFLIYPGLDVSAAGLGRRLDRLAYLEVGHEPSRGGEMRSGDDSLEIALRSSGQGVPQAHLVRILLENDRVREISDLRTGERIGAVALEPEELTGIYQGDWQGRRAIRLSEVSPILIRAVLATEDARYFDHNGIDYVGIGRALLANLQSGQVRQGGSTLTQQLMKNFFLSSERTYSRKLHEIAMALVAEQKYSKEAILEAYLNEIYLGQRGARGVYGVAEASRFFFGKNPSEIDVGEAAMLAGLIRAPSAYSPRRYPERARARRDTVLRLLYEAGDIDQRTWEQARASELGALPPRKRQRIAPFFVDAVERELSERFPRGALTSEGFSVHTTLDPMMQEWAEEALRSGLERVAEQRAKSHPVPENDRLEAALVAISPRTGEIRAMVGGRNYQESQFNRVTDAMRQPGSAFKPFVFLVGLLQTDPGRHINAATTVEDAPFTWSYELDQNWAPKNYGDKYFGEVTVRTALEKSLNAAVARIAWNIGLEEIAEFGEHVGIPGPLLAVPSIVLGSLEVSPLDMTAAYGIFASGGIRAEPNAITRVETRDGATLVGHPPEMRRIVSPAEAFVITHILEGVMARGTGRSARWRGFKRQAAGKTGTTNGYRDAWFIGYTPDLLAGVWVGYDGGTPLELSGASAALPIWTEFMKHAVAADLKRGFSVPPGITMVEVDRHTGLPPLPVEQPGGPDAEAFAGETAFEAGADEAKKPPVELILEAFLTGDEPTFSRPLALSADFVETLGADDLPEERVSPSE